MKKKKTRFSFSSLSSTDIPPGIFHPHQHHNGVASIKLHNYNQGCNQRITWKKMLTVYGHSRLLHCDYSLDIFLCIMMSLFSWWRCCEAVCGSPEPREVESHDKHRSIYQNSLNKEKFEIGMAVVRRVCISTCCLAFHLSNTYVVATFSSVLVTPRGPCGRKMAT